MQVYVTGDIEADPPSLYAHVRVRLACILRLSPACSACQQRMLWRLASMASVSGAVLTFARNVSEQA